MTRGRWQNKKLRHWRGEGGRVAFLDETGILGKSSLNWKLGSFDPILVDFHPKLLQWGRNSIPVT
jgi:hypothetical protein